MNQRQKKISGMRVGIIASLILATLHIILIGGTFIRRSTIQTLEADRVALEENFNQLEEVNQEQLNALKAELAEIEDEISELQASFPELGSPFALFQRALEFSETNQVELSSISRDDPELQDTSNGFVIIEEYDLELEGSLKNCIGFIEEIEKAGLDTVIMQSANFQPEDELCFLDIRTLGVINTSED
jgi:hypothetical protein